MNAVEVFRVPWARKPWVIRCAHCDGWHDAHESWGTAISEAQRHAAEHEQRRCAVCGRTS